jgi:DNA polymerase III alpha subunit (gram-positive type)
MEFIGDKVLVFHNAPFDLKFIDKSAERLDVQFTNRKIDTLTHSRRMFRQMENHKLVTLVDALCLSDGESMHRSGIDALCTGRLLLKCLAEYERQDEVKKAERKAKKANEKQEESGINDVKERA